VAGLYLDIMIMNVYNDKNSYGKTCSGCPSYTKASFFPLFILGCGKKRV
jgi:hypothetical protein